MLKKQVVFFILAFLFFYSLCYAENMFSDQAADYYKEGVKAQKASNYAMADENYQKTLLLDPYNNDWKKFIVNNRGVMFAKMGDMMNAERMFNEALKIDPDYELAKLNLGLIVEGRLTRLEYLEYWMKMLNIDIEKLKPKSYGIQEQELPEKE